VTLRRYLVEQDDYQDFLATLRPDRRQNLYNALVEEVARTAGNMGGNGKGGRSGMFTLEYFPSRSVCGSPVQRVSRGSGGNTPDSE
jgi:hypothetical protein